MIETIVGVIALIIGGVSVFIYRNWVDQNTKKSAQVEAKKIVQRAKSESSRVEKDAKRRAKEFEQRAKRNAENEIAKQKDKLARTEKSFLDKKKSLDHKQKSFDDEIQIELKKVEDQKARVKIAETKVKSQEAQVIDLKSRLQGELEKIAGMSQSQAKEKLVTVMEEEAKADFSRKLISLEEEYKERSEKKANRIISLAVSRVAGDYAAERVITSVSLASEEMKGKVIGKEGRNIRAMEAVCGVDLIVDEVPDTVIISGFDPVRREVARRALIELLEDGRVHPGRIEEVVRKTKSRLLKELREDGEKAINELNLTGVHPEILKLVGSLKYRTSFSQNNYYHSIEVGNLAGMMAAELGGNVKVAKRAGLLHDIGKAIDHSVEGSHAVIGADFAKKYGEKEAVCHAIRSHHEDEMPNSMIAHLVQAADAISSARPGARKSTQANYIKRLEDLESIGNSFDGVLRTFAVQAGREVRIIVDSALVTDEQSVMLSKDIAKKIEREMNYPGQIKITVMRETRAVEHAR